jgi:hypothetical protein
VIGEDLPRRIELTGWSTVLLGALCLGLAALELAIPVLLRRLESASGFEGAAAISRLREAFTEGAALAAAVNALFGAALVAVGAGVCRRAAWSHRALMHVGWASIPAVAVLAGPGVAPLLAMSESTAGSTALLLGASVVLLVLQVVAVLRFLRFWRRDEVRARFR